MRSILTRLALGGVLIMTSLGGAMTSSFAQNAEGFGNSASQARPLPRVEEGISRPPPPPRAERPPRVEGPRPPRVDDRRVERSRDRDWRRDRDRRDWRRNRDWDRGYRGGGYYYRDRGPTIYYDVQPSYRYVEPRYVAPAPRYAPARGLSRAHVDWCHARWRSYRAYDNTYQPYNGPRRQCYSPYS